MAEASGEIRDEGVGVGDRLERLWSPHRMTYIADPQPAAKTGHPPFLDIPTMSDEDGLIVARGEAVYAVLNLYPYNPGHTMVVPYRQVADLEDLTPAESAELMAFTQRMIRTIKAVSNPNAFNVGLNLAMPRVARCPSTYISTSCLAGWATRTSSPSSARRR